MNFLQNRGLRFKLALGIVLTMLISLGIVYFGISRYIQTQLWQRETQAAENLNAIAESLIDDAMMAGRKDKIHDALENLGKSVGGQIDSIAIYDDQSVLTSLATGFPGGRNISPENFAVDVTTDPTCQICHQLPPENRPKMAVITLEGEQVIRNVVPLYNEPRCQTCHGMGAMVLGDSIVDYRIEKYQRAVTTITIGFGLGILAAIIFVTFVLYQLLHRVVISPVDELVSVTYSVVRGNLKQRVQVRSDDEIGQLGSSFNSMTEQIRNILGELEKRVADRTRTLEQRTSYLEASANVSRTAATVLDPRSLILQVVDLIKESFDLYYVGLFLVDERNEWCFLQAGTGEPGREMVEQRYRIKVGEGMIGWCVANSQARIALDSGLDAVRFENPLLPSTRSECALPLRSRGQMLGAISVQSEKPSAFDENIITVLQTMADQIAVALDNAELITKAESALEAERRAFGEMSHQEWLKTLMQTDLGVLASDRIAEQTISENWTPQMQLVRSTGKITRYDKDTIHIPIILREQTLGVVRLRKQEGERSWSAEEIDFMDSLVDQLETALEAARLYTETQTQAKRERVMHDITDKLHRSLDINSLMELFLEEISTALGTTGAFIQLSTDIPNTESASKN